MLNRWIQFLLNRARFVLVAGIVVTIAAAAYGIGVFDSLGKGGFDDKHSDSAKELAQEQHLFGSKNVDVIVLYRSKDLSASDAAFRAQVDHTLAGIPAGTTTSVITPWSIDGKRLAKVNPQLVSTDAHAVQVLISVA